ncbi:transmembrane protein 130 [Betta splendens]|uniref:Transmembrane protein 130 n=1 Tax=Betta splendens TaxID=158456 RepID=A0A6P7L491_BETSP|nr:transmembrane protein 130 [Betta splendens]
MIWIWMFPVLVMLGVAQTSDPLTNLDYIAGTLIFYQKEGNATYLRNTGHLASVVPTETTFEFFDARNNLTPEQRTYTWDLGNGEVIQGTEPFVQYSYPQSGNYTLRLKVGVNVTESGPQITGVYSRDVQVLDAIKEVKLKGASYYSVSENTTLTFHIDGSPPMRVCSRFYHNCGPDVTGGCTLTMLYETNLSLSHTFTSAGVHCLDISVRNDISNLQVSFSLDVRGNYNTQIFLIMFSAAVLVAAICFIVRRRYKRSQIAISSNATFLKNQDYHDQSMSLLDMSTVKRSDKESRLLQYGTHYF